MHQATCNDPNYCCTSGAYQIGVSYFILGGYVLAFVLCKLVTLWSS